MEDSKKIVNLLLLVNSPSNTEAAVYMYTYLRVRDAEIYGPIYTWLHNLRLWEK